MEFLFLAQGLFLSPEAKNIPYTLINIELLFKKKKHFGKPKNVI